MARCPTRDTRVDARAATAGGVSSAPRRAAAGREELRMPMGQRVLLTAGDVLKNMDCAWRRPDGFGLRRRLHHLLELPNQSGPLSGPTNCRWDSNRNVPAFHQKFSPSGLTAAGRPGTYRRAAPRGHGAAWT